MLLETKRVYIRDWHGRFAHVPGSAQSLPDVATGEPIPEPIASKGWSRVDPALVAEHAVSDLIAEGIEEKYVRDVVERMGDSCLPRVYTNGSVNLRIHPDVPIEHDQRILHDTAFLTFVSPLENLDIRIDDDFVTHGSGAELDFGKTGCVGWTETTPGAGNTTLAVRPRAWEPHQKTQAGLLMRSSDANRGLYFLAHEWGHASIQPRDRGAEYEARLYHLFGTHPLSGSMYGATNPDEFYAENFAEWHVSGGTTSNKVTQQMAIDFGWFGAGELPPGSGLPQDPMQRSRTADEAYFAGLGGRD